MADEKKSIFDLADKFGVVSPYGDWVKEDFKQDYVYNARIVSISISRSNKKAAITNPKSTKTPIYIVIMAKIEGEENVIVDISCLGGAVPDGSNQINNKKRDNNTGIISYEVTRVFYVSVDKKTFQPNAYTAWVRITSRGKVTDNKDQKFSVASNGQISEVGTEIESTRRDCFCKKATWSVDDVKYLVTELRKGDIINPKGKAVKNEQGKTIDWVAFTVYDDITSDKKQIKDRLFYLKKDEKIDSKDATYGNLTKYLNATFQQYGINTCLRKIHFLAQTYQESQKFSSTYENVSGKDYSGGDFYQGRGLIQITHDYNYKALYKSFFNAEPTDEELEEFTPKIASNLEYAVKSAGWFWKKNNINKYADLDDVERVSAAINYPSLLNDKVFNSDKINGLESRKKYYLLLKNILDYEICGK